VYDVTSEQSFENVKNWLDQISDHASEHAQLILVGNKSDMVRERCVDSSRGEELAKSLKIPFIETSAKNSVNVEEAFTQVVKRVVQDHNESHGGGTDTEPSTVIMEVKGPNKTKRLTRTPKGGSSQPQCACK
jgi:GTPase SAR1 family protein